MVSIGGETKVKVSIFRRIIDNVHSNLTLL